MLISTRLQNWLGLLFLLLWHTATCAQGSGELRMIDVLSAQKKNRISLAGKSGHEYVQNVKIRHGHCLLTCDWAFCNDSSNQLLAVGNIHLTLDESTTALADTIRYLADAQQAFLTGRVIFRNYGLVLNTSQLDYSQRTGIVHYADQPRLVGGNYLMTIREGYYNRTTQQFSISPDVPPIVVSLGKAARPPAAVADEKPVSTPPTDSIQSAGLPVTPDPTSTKPVAETTSSATRPAVPMPPATAPAPAQPPGRAPLNRAVVKKFAVTPPASTTINRTKSPTVITSKPTPKATTEGELQ